VVLLPLWLQQWMGYTSTWAGLATAPVGVLAIIMSPWVGRNVVRLDPRKLVTFAFLGFAFVMWLRSRFDTQVPFEVVVLPIVLQGAVMPFFFIPLQSILFRGLTPEQMPGASGLSNFARICAGGIGTSIFTTLWERRAALHHAQLVESVHSGNPALAVTGERLAAAGLSPEQVAATIARQIDQQAHTMAVTDLFLLSSAVFIGLIALVWLTRPRPPTAAGHAIAAAD
jgi:DHA2 family multidrug resistance protein